MSIPDFQSLMLPLLDSASDGEIRTLSDTREHLASVFALTCDEIEELLPSGRQRRFANRVAWAKVYLEQAGLLISPKRGRFQITPEGKAFLETNPNKITIASLDQFEKFRAFRTSAKTSKKEQEAVCSPETTETPEELLEQSYQSINEELAGSLLEQVKQCSPAFFENLVVELLLKMGYGRNRVEAGKAIGKSGG